MATLALRVSLGLRLSVQEARGHTWPQLLQNAAWHSTAGVPWLTEAVITTAVVPPETVITAPQSLSSLRLSRCHSVD